MPLDINLSILPYYILGFLLLLASFILLVIIFPLGRVIDKAAHSLKREAIVKHIKAKFETIHIGDNEELMIERAEKLKEQQRQEILGPWALDARVKPYTSKAFQYLRAKELLETRGVRTHKDAIGAGISGMYKPKVVSLNPSIILPMSELLSDVIDMSTVELVELSPGASDEEIYQACKGATVIIGDYSAQHFISREIIESAERLRHIQFVSAGYNGVNIEATRDLGVTVSDGFSDRVSVAEHTIMLILMLLRKAIYSHNATVEGQWVQCDIWTDIAPFRGKTLGIVGLGNIGKQVAKRARAFAVNTVYTKRNRLTPGEEAELGVEYRSFDELLEHSDIITIHVPLTDRTRGMFGEKEFERMKPGAFLVNTARGGILDEAALAEAVKAGKLSGAAVDYEPISPESPLRGLEEIIITPHTGAAGSTEEGQRTSASKIADNIAIALAGGRPLNIVNGL